MDALERFRSEFRGWVRAYNRVKKISSIPDEVLMRLEKRIPEAMLRQIGASLINGWVVTEDSPERRYFVKESDRFGPGGGLWTLEPAGNHINPCWELHVQLADYGRLRTIAERYGLTTRLEDNLMDITVYSGKNLILYVENKTKKVEALRLVKKMREYGKSGFDIGDPDRGNDQLKKSKYLVRNDAYPKFFAISAIGFEQVFRVDYIGKDNRFLLHDTEMTLTEPLHNTIPEGKPEPRAIVDPLALEIERIAGDKVWVSLGSGQTAYNFYVSSNKKDSIFLGIYSDGRIWTDIKSLKKETAKHLSENLASIGISIDLTKDWNFWKRDGQDISLHKEDPTVIAKQVVAAIFPKLELNTSQTPENN